MDSSTASNLVEAQTKGKLHKCPMDNCSAAYTKQWKLTNHLRKHTGERPYVCDIPGCQFSYTTVAHLKRHKCLVHEKACEVVCKVEGCGKVFNNKYSLKKHCNQLHEPVDYAFHCLHCSEGFNKKRQLRVHIFTHTGDTPYKCTKCNLGFTKLHLYNKHKSNHKTYTCDCGKVFEKWSLFCEHRKASCHIKKIDHKCIICNKVFTTKTNLNQHSLTHVEESQIDIHRCPYMGCTRSYKYKKNLNSHIASFHEKINETVVNKCTVPGCERVLKTKRLLKLHLERIHNKPKIKKKRLPRKDKGKSKKSMASILSGVILPYNEHKNLLTNSDHPSNIEPIEDTPKQKDTAGNGTDNVRRIKKKSIHESEETVESNKSSINITDKVVKKKQNREVAEQF
ncbi:hypothetical protein NQ317_011449 [Molorchus minor]|uniref:C2H2-type domain-containing protein n=1 Tax=Molorchus minor TaxID=1323400 RepID=A0ABQ9IV31_9CUCU|nr:hypothetical protein NQ317_011449 [Molorchus minor]